MKNIHKKSGYSLIELVLVMMLLVLVASLVFSLTAAGSEAWMRITAAENRRSELRTAMSYIDVQLKKSDNLDSISIEPDPFGGQQAIRIVREIRNPTIPDYNQSEIWIYIENGKLFELHTLPGIPLKADVSSGQPLISADDWRIRVVTDELLEVTLILRSSDGRSEITEQLTRQFYIRSGGLSS